MVQNQRIVFGTSHKSGKAVKGVHTDYFVKLDFEIAVDQQTRARDWTFEGVLDSGCPPVPEGQPRPYLVNLWPNFALCAQTLEFGRQNILKT